MIFLFPSVGVFESGCWTVFSRQLSEGLCEILCFFLGCSILGVTPPPSRYQHRWGGTEPLVGALIQGRSHWAYIRDGNRTFGIIRKDNTPRSHSVFTEA